MRASPPSAKLVDMGNARIQIDVAIVERLLAEGHTLGEAARALGVGEETLRRARKRAGLPKLKKGPRSPEHNRAWKGGRIIDVDGYVLVRVKDHPSADSRGYVREHRLIVERLLGRHLSPEEIVHHLDGDRANNDPANLELFASNGDHLRATLAGQVPRHTPEGRRRMSEATSAGLHRYWADVKAGRRSR